MPTSIREQCLAALQTLLLTLADVPATEDPPVLAGLRVDRNTDFDEDESVAHSLIQFDGDEELRGTTTQTDEKTVEVDIEGTVRGADRAELNSRCDALEVAVCDLVLGDPTLGGIAFDVRQNGTPARRIVMDAATPTMKVTIPLAVDFEHAAGRIAAAAP